MEMEHESDCDRARPCHLPGKDEGGETVVSTLQSLLSDAVRVYPPSSSPQFPSLELAALLSHEFGYIS